MIDIVEPCIRSGPKFSYESYAEERDDRIRYAAEILRSNHPLDAGIRDAIADLLEEKKKRGRPESGPQQWYDVFSERERGLTISELSEKFCISISTVRRCLACGKEYSEMMREIERESNFENTTGGD